MAKKKDDGAVAAPKTTLTVLQSEVIRRIEAAGGSLKSGEAAGSRQHAGAAGTLVERGYVVKDGSGKNGTLNLTDAGKTWCANNPA